MLGDVHFDPLYEIDYLEDVVARVNSLAPDLVLYTGDFLSKSADRLPDLLTVLRRRGPQSRLHDDLSTRADGRRRRSAKARNRGK